MKQKCEEIIIEQYLKGIITDEEKNRQLGGLTLLEEGQEVLKEIYTKLTKCPEEFFKHAQVMYKKCDEHIKTFISDHDLHHLSASEQKLSFGKNVLLPELERNAVPNELRSFFKNIIKEMEEELEDELSE